MLPVYRLLADRIGGRLGRPVELVVGRSFDQFAQGAADLGVICGLPYVWLAARRPPPVEPLAAPVLAGDRYGGRPIYYSDVIVRHDSPISCLEELRGCSWAYNEPASHSGHTVTLYSLIHMGPGRGSLLGWWRRASTSGPSVWSSRAPWTRRRSTPRSWPSSSATIHGWPTACGRSGAFGPSTIQPVVAASRLPDWLKDQAQELLVKLGDGPTARPVLDHGVIDHFAPVDDAAYDDIRAMLTVIQAAGWTSLTQTV